MKGRVEDDAAAFIRRHAPRLGVTPTGLRVNSPAFWRAIRQVLPEYQREHAWFRRHLGWEL